MTNQDLEMFRLNSEEGEALKILNHVNDMASDGATMYEVQMYLYNN